MRLATMLGIVALGVVAMVPLSATDAGAADNKVYRFIYPIITPSQTEGAAGPGGAFSIRGSVGFAFTGGPGPEATNVNVAVLDQPVACFSGTPNTAGGDWQVDWGTPCVNPTDFCVLRFTTPKGPITIERAYWANDLGDSIAPAIVEQLNAPAADPRGLLALAVGMFGAGAWFMFRRRPIAGRA